MRPGRRLVAFLSIPGVLIAAATGVEGQLRYDREHPSIPYASATPTDPVAQLFQRVARGEVSLAFEGQNGYLASLLSALQVPASSQSLVFSRTSFQKGLISPANPRAIYFDDEVYVAWTRGGDFVEIAAVDPLLGAVFYTLAHEPAARPTLTRQMQLCLQCHDTYGLTGGGVPELIIGSMLPDANGNAVAHEGWFETTHSSPLRVRWGGWYVTGTHGEQTHMGNAIVKDPATLPTLDFRASGNLTDLASVIDTSPLQGPTSDIVALMVMEHQVTVQNQIIHLNYQLRDALAAGGLAATTTGTVPADIQAVLEKYGDALVRGLLFAGEAPIQSRIRGNSGFEEAFSARGPFDTKGRSLRQMDLERRMFRYPLSYLIYSPAFEGLPPLAKGYVTRRISEVLAGRDTTGEFGHLSAQDRQAIREILSDTRPGLLGG